MRSFTPSVATLSDPVKRDVPSDVQANIDAIQRIAWELTADITQCREYCLYPGNERGTRFIYRDKFTELKVNPDGGFQLIVDRDSPLVARCFNGLPKEYLSIGAIFFCEQMSDGSYGFLTRIQGPSVYATSYDGGNYGYTPRLEAAENIQALTQICRELKANLENRSGWRKDRQSNPV